MAHQDPGKNCVCDLGLTYEKRIRQWANPLLCAVTVFKMLKTHVNTVCMNKSIKELRQKKSRSSHLCTCRALLSLWVISSALDCNYTFNECVFIGAELLFSRQRQKALFQICAPLPEWIQLRLWLVGRLKIQHWKMSRPFAFIYLQENKKV